MFSHIFIFVSFFHLLHVVSTSLYTYEQLIPNSSQWYDKLRAEIKYFEDINIDIDKLMNQNRESDKIRGQMAVLERRVQVSIAYSQVDI